jgi:CPA1 family monovalent cation:H+ antiporter
VGAALGLVAACVLPWLDRLPAVALSLALAYGSFVLADEVLGFSGVLATAAAGMVLSGLSSSRATAEVREAWDQTWEALDYIANALLFLLIGLVLDPGLLADNLGAILLTVVAVLLARAAAVVPVVWLLERLAHVPRVGRRNEAVLVWGGLRGGVALALALALPEELAERDMLVALTGGVVLATLLLNATTISWLVHRLRLDEASPVDRFLAAVARLSGVQEAQRRVDELGLADADQVAGLLADAEHQARDELHRLELTEDQEMRVVLGRALHIERSTYQQLADEGLLPPDVTRALLSQVDDEVDELSIAAPPHVPGTGRRKEPPLGRLTRRLLAWLPEPVGEDAGDLAYAEAAARRLAARQTSDALEVFERLPGVAAETVEQVRRTFQDWERAADEALAELDHGSDRTRQELHERQAELLARAASARQLRELVSSGIVPEELVRTLPPLTGQGR